MLIICKLKIKTTPSSWSEHCSTKLHNHQDVAFAGAEFSKV